MSDRLSYRDRAIRALTEVTETGFFGERQGGWMTLPEAEGFVDELVAAARTGDLARISDLRATLSLLSSGGRHPDSFRLADVRRAAEDALRRDDVRALATG